MSAAANAFISRWSKASPSERANSQLFLSELCDLIGVPHPDPNRDNGYLLNLSEYEIASVQVLSQRLDLIEELQTFRAQTRRPNNGRRSLGTLPAEIRNKQKVLLAARHFLLAMTGRLGTEHQKLEALVTTLKSRSPA